MELFSEAFEDGGRIPARYTADGEGLSPPIGWRGVPEGAVELVLFCTDEDERLYPEFIQWVVYAIPADLDGLPEGLPKAHEVSRPRVLQGDSDKGTAGWLPPRGDARHRYAFTLYALDVDLRTGAAMGKGALMDLMEGHVLKSAKLHASHGG